jgi:cytidine deaminase
MVQLGRRPPLETDVHTDQQITFLWLFEKEALPLNNGWVLSAVAGGTFLSVQVLRHPVGRAVKNKRMEKKTIQIDIQVYPGSDALAAADAALLQQAREVTERAYAPYSHFHVGAVALLANGQTVIGTNQENASYPVGICAERVLLSAVAALHPNVAIHTIAISYQNMLGESKHPISPCGICRQSLVEYEQRTETPIRLILSGMEGPVYVVEQAGQLLPLGFTAADMEEGVMGGGVGNEE